MHDIDFLPPKYRDLSARRNIKLSRVVVVGAFALAIVGAAVMQRHIHSQLVAEVDGVQPLHATAELLSRDLTATNEQLDAENRVADLITYMRHPWPRTQLLAVVLAPLPESLSLDQINNIEQKIEKKTTATQSMRRNRKRKARANEEDGTDKLAPAQRDLKHLRATSDLSQTVIIVTGRTQDRAALYYYLARLGESEFIVKAELKSVEAGHDRRAVSRVPVRGQVQIAQQDEQPPTPTTKFVARLVVSRGYGQGSPKKQDSDHQDS
jgi:Tfp pilus assembly protein PilN